MSYVLENGAIYFKNDKIIQMIGALNKIETIRIDNETVADVTYEFDFGSSSYIEVSRTTRNEPLPPPAPTLEERTAALEAMMNVIFA